MLDPISYDNMPLVPAPMSSTDDGETWIWGDFYLTLQKEPETVAQKIAKFSGREAVRQSIKHLYAMSAFYRLDKCPHDLLLAFQPVLVATLEQADYKERGRMLSEMFGASSALPSMPELGPAMVCLFDSDRHYTFGEYDGELTRDAVRRELLQLLREGLGVSGAPRKIGALLDAFEHPETGLSLSKTHRKMRQ